VIAAYALCVRSGAFVQRLIPALRLSLPYWLVLAAYLVTRLRILGFVAIRQRIWELTPLQTGLNMLHLVSLYWWKLALPVHLNAYYVFSPIRSVWDIRVLAGAVFIAAAGIAIAYALRRAPLIAFSAVWVFVTLLPVMNIYGVGRNVFAERYLYLPSFGFCLLVVLLADLTIRRFPAQTRLPVAAALLAVVVLCFSFQTWERNRAWANDGTLFQETLLSSPDAPFVQFMVASTEKDGAPQVAEEHYLEAIRLAQSEQPPDLLDLSRSYEGLISLYSDRGEHDRAADVLRQWRSAVPSEPQADIEEGLLLLQAGQWRQAEPLLRKASLAAPQNENVWNALGLLAWQYLRDPDNAITCFSRALDIHTARDQFRASLYNNLGGVYGDREEFALAIEHFQDAVAISPANAEYHTNLATAMAAVAHYRDAQTEVDAALKIEPGYAPARELQGQLQRYAVPH